MKKRILISIDHKWRDLPGYVYLGYLLKKKNFKVEYCRNGLERFYIQGFKPHIVVINHLLDKRRQDYYNKTVSFGTKVVILPTEGIPTLEKERDFAAGIANNLSSVALHFLWNEPMKKITAKNTTISEEKLKVIGVPRFDFYKNPLSKTLISKNKFIKKYNLKENFPIITFATNYINAQFTTQNQDFIEQDSAILGYNKVYSDIEIKYTIPGQDFKSRDIAIKAFINLVKEFEDVNFILKLHPSEEHIYYFNLLQNELKDYTDRVTVIIQEYIWDILSVTDIELKRSCTTGIESWILGHPTIEMKLNPNEWYYSPEHVVGSDIITSYDELKNSVSAYLNGKEITADKKQKREDFLNTWCYKVDGQSTFRAAEEINKLEIKNITVPSDLKTLLVYYVLKYGNNYLHDLKVYGLRSMFKKDRTDKLGRIDKHFNDKDIRKWEKLFENQ